MGVLGSMILSSEAVYLAKDALSAESFYKLAHQDIFRAIVQLSDTHNAVDIILLRDELSKQGKLDGVGVAYVLEVAESVPTSANVELYIGIVRQQALRRKLMVMAQRVQDAAPQAGREVDALLVTVSQWANELADSQQKKAVSIGEALAEAEKVLEERAARDERKPVAQTGLPWLDRRVQLMPGRLVILGGRPGAGKSALAMQILNNVCNAGLGALLFSPEIDRLDTAVNLMRLRTGVDYMSVRKGTFAGSSFQRWQTESQKLAKAALYIDDTPGVRIETLANRALSLARRTSLALIVLDYIQLVRSGLRVKRNLEVAHIVQELKRVGREAGCVMLALSQVGRPAKDRPANLPKWSGEIEEASDVVLTLAREKKYEWGSDEEEPDVCGRLLSIEKNKQGPSGRLMLTFDKPALRLAEVGGAGGRGAGEPREAGQGSRNGGTGDGAGPDRAAEASGQDDRPAGAEVPDTGGGTGLSLGTSPLFGELDVPDDQIPF